MGRHLLQRGVDGEGAASGSCQLTLYVGSYCPADHAASDHAISSVLVYREGLQLSYRKLSLKAKCAGVVD